MRLAMDPTGTMFDAGARGPVRVLVVQGGRSGARPLAPGLEGLDCEVFQAGSAAAALNAVRRESFDIALCELEIGRESGLDLLPRLVSEQPGLAVVMVTAAAGLTTAMEAMRLGARDYLSAPVSLLRLRELLDEERARRDRRPPSWAERPPSPAPLDAASPRMRAALREVERVAALDTPVLLLGESGTGKSVLARAIHARGPRRDRPFVVVSCRGLSDEALSRELFGRAPGGSPGAPRGKEGRFPAAAGGTLFLDGLGEIGPVLLADLDRFAREAPLERPGETRARTAYVRLIVSSTRADGPRAPVEAVEITVPPLRERIEDILPLARTFAEAAARRAGTTVPDLSPAARELLVASPWPGNVRELRGAVERALLGSPGATLLPDAFPELAARRATSPSLGGDFSAEEIEREHVLRVLARAPSLVAASRILGIPRNSLSRKRRKWGR